MTISRNSILMAGLIGLFCVGCKQDTPQPTPPAATINTPTNPTPNPSNPGPSPSAPLVIYNGQSGSLVQGGAFEYPSGNTTDVSFNFQDSNFSSSGFPN